MQKIQSLRAEQSRAEQSRAEQLNDCVKVIGCMDHTLDHTYESANRVYDDNGIAPTVNTCGGGGLQPKVVEVKKVINRQIVAMRGRNPDNPSDRKPGIELEQRLEPNSENMSNTITSVQKDNLVLETEILGGLEENSSQRRKVYNKDGVCPTLQAAMGMGGGCVPFVTEEKIVAIDEQNKCIRTETFGCLTTDGSSPKHNNRVAEINKLDNEIINPLADNEDVGWHFAQNVYDENSPLIRSIKAGGGSGNTPKVIQVRQATEQGFTNVEIGGVVDLNYPTSQTRRGRAIENGQISPTLTTESTPSVIELGDPDFYNFLYEIDGEIYLIRIRKLTPRECWRLMDFNESAFDEAEKVNSNTQLYKQAGNSIVVNVLTAIFGQMFEGKEEEYKNF